MNEEKIKYKKLPGRGMKKGPSSLVARTFAKLWLGPDHLLCQYVTGYSEQYRRFYFRDIQGIVAAHTRRGMIINIILSAVLLPIAVMMIRDMGDTMSPWFILGIISTPILLPLLLGNIIMGPTAKAYLMTATTIEELPSLNRLNRARKVIARLTPLIEEAQGGRLPADSLAAALSTPMPQTGAAATAMPHRAQAGPQSVPLGPRSINSEQETEDNGYGGALHAWLFANILVVGLTLLVDYSMPSLWPTLLMVFSLLPVSFLMVGSLIKQQHSRLSGMLKITTWITLGYVLLSMVMIYTVYFYLAIKDGKALSAGKSIFTILSGYEIGANSFLSTVFIIGALLSIAIGTTGLAGYSSHQRSQR